MKYECEHGHGINYVYNFWEFDKIGLDEEGNKIPKVKKKGDK